MRFFCKRYFDWLFTAGLLFSALISVNRQYGFLPDFLEGALTGLAIVFLLLPRNAPTQQKAHEGNGGLAEG